MNRKAGSKWRKAVCGPTTPFGCVRKAEQQIVGPSVLRGTIQYFYRAFFHKVTGKMPLSD